MDFQQVKELIQMVEQSSLTELQVSLDGSSLYMSKNAVNSGNNAAAVRVDTPSAAPVSITPSADEPITILPEVKQETKAGEMIVSPIVGTFYESASPEKPAFVKVNDEVREGQVLCIVEAMKVMNEITAKRSGVIAEVLVENEQMVEFNQPLFRIV